MTGDASPGATPEPSLTVAPGPRDGLVRLPSGEVVRPPRGWALLAPGDAAITRRVKASGPAWTVQVRKGRRTFSHGVWAPSRHIEEARAHIAAVRATPEHAKKQAAAARRRDAKQDRYAGEFHAAVVRFLEFHPVYREHADAVAERVTEHAVPIGSGTVARTERIPLERRAEAAVIAWMRHRTTAYERLSIPRVKGKRREVRRMLAERSRDLLGSYRRGEPVDEAVCPLARAIADA